MYPEPVIIHAIKHAINIGIEVLKGLVYGLSDRWIEGCYIELKTSILNYNERMGKV